MSKTSQKVLAKKPSSWSSRSWTYFVEQNVTNLDALATSVQTYRYRHRAAELSDQGKVASAGAEEIALINAARNNSGQDVVAGPSFFEAVASVDLKQQWEDASLGDVFASAVDYGIDEAGGLAEGAMMALDFVGCASNPFRLLVGIRSAVVIVRVSGLRRSWLLPGRCGRLRGRVTSKRSWRLLPVLGCRSRVIRGLGL